MSSRKDTLFQLILIRLIFVTAILIASVIVQFSTATFLPLNHLYWLIGAAYVLSLIYFILHHFWNRHDRQATLQILLDLMWITAVVYISGGLQGSFYFIYIFEIIAAGIVITLIF